MTEKGKYKFKLLNETSASEDLFDDKTHEKIADTLYNLIQDGISEGITIGLEGGWGSGKSTVVSILRNKLKSEKKGVIYFYFDAWAHEGDPLRRIFLEALIEQITDDNSENIFDKADFELLEKKKKEISKREKKSHITTKRTATGLGKILAIAAFLVPFGVAMISGTLSKLCFHCDGDIHWLFLVGLICALAPAFVILCNILRLLIFSKIIFDSSNWIFLQSESDEDMTQEVSENEERSSIEFERYFLEILDVIFSKNKDTKLVIVIDNLDRVDADDSLKIWSTLQTFLQHRNPNPSDKVSIYSNKIWVLVPYDKAGLVKLWENHATKQGSDDSHEGCAKSFFDKCFQLRIEVPRLIPTGWESFCQNNINEALNGWDEDEKKDVLDVLKWTRKDVNDIPTPREIKTYINQVGLLRQHCDSQISTKAIAYFSVQKYIIKFQENKDIESQLISGRHPSNELKPIFNEQLTAELCGILFGVSAEKGQQLLLEPEIQNTLRTKGTEKIKTLSEIHNNAFWTVLNLHLSRRCDTNTILDYSYTIWHGLWDDAPDKCEVFIRYLKTTIDSGLPMSFPTPNSIDNYIAAFSLLDASNNDLSKYWNDIMHSLNELIKKGDYDSLSYNKILMTLVSCQKRKAPQQQTLADVPFENWIKWASAAISEKYNSYMFVKPPNTLTNDIAGKIKAGNPLPARLHDLINYMINGGETLWQKVVDAMGDHINWNDGNPSPDIFSIDHFRILALLSSQGELLRGSFDPIIRNGAFYNLAFHLREQGAVKYVALITARYFPENFNSIEILHKVNSAQGIEELNNFWINKNVDNANFIWNEIKNLSDFEFIWKLAKVNNNKLVGDIIKIAMKEDCPEFFNYKNALQLFKEAILVINDGESFDVELMKCFIKYSQIEKEILESNDLDINTFAYALNILARNTDNKEIINYLIKKINAVTEKQWDKALRDDIYLTTLAVTINEKSSELSFVNDLYNSLFSYLKAWITNSVTPSEAKQNELPKLIAMLDDDFYQQLRNRLTEHLIDVKFKGSFAAISALLEHINIENFVTDGRRKIQNATEDALKNSDINAIEIIVAILSHPEGAKFKPDKTLVNVLTVPMKRLFYSNKEIDKALIERLALIFKVDISENSNDIIILSATYGKDDKMYDVTDCVKKLVNAAGGEQVSFQVENPILGGDPPPLQGILKELIITYSYKGKEHSITIEEHKTVTIP